MKKTKCTSKKSGNGNSLRSRCSRDRIACAKAPERVSGTKSEAGEFIAKGHGWYGKNQRNKNEAGSRQDARRKYKMKESWLETAKNEGH